MVSVSVLELKIISTTALFILSLIGGIIPYWMKNLKNSARYLSWSNAFGGGVFFGAGMLHLFATADEEMQPYIIKYNYPLAALCLCGGFLFTLFIELFINSMFMNSTIFNELHGHGHSSHHQAHEEKKQQQQQQKHGHGHGHGHGDSGYSEIKNIQYEGEINEGIGSILTNSQDFEKIVIVEPNEKQKLLNNSINQPQQQLQQQTNYYGGINGGVGSNYNNNNNNQHIDIDKSGTAFIPNSGRQPKSHNKSLSYRFPQEPSQQQFDDSEPEIIIDYDDEDNVVSFISNEGRTRGNSSESGGTNSNINVNRKNSLINKHDDDYYQKEEKQILNEQQHQQIQINQNEIDQQQQKQKLIDEKKEKSKKTRNLLLPFLLVIALSIHSLFEGLAMGIQSSEIHVIDILIAIFAHKILASFALGVSTVTSSIGKPSFLKLFLLVLIFSLTSPIGSIIGMVVSSQVASSLIPSILQGIASGTFLYVAVVEVIPKELGHDSDDILIKSILLFLGWAFMGVVAIWV